MKIKDIIGITILMVMFISVLGLSISVPISFEYENYIDNHTEVGTYEYNKVIEWSKEFPAIKYLVSTEYYVDGIIYKYEYKELQELYTKQETLKDKLTKVPEVRRSLNEIINKECH